ncbi:hypothetical protein PF001_g13580 [Phytophthora fragariae]|uniref:Protein kinase domain-containing protein n=2 Tax=Phytophthora fragariae TaxID=53985 RepID=A0A6A4DBT9_9STRA|nr:hypothetical protein PF001_g13580 [Phytophthora fragariae]
MDDEGRSFIIEEFITSWLDESTDNSKRKENTDGSDVEQSNETAVQRRLVQDVALVDALAPVRLKHDVRVERVGARGRQRPHPAGAAGTTRRDTTMGLLRNYMEAMLTATLSLFSSPRGSSSSSATTPKKCNKKTSKQEPTPEPTPAPMTTRTTVARSPPQRLSDLKVVETLAPALFGGVLLCVHSRTGRQLAIKRVDLRCARTQVTVATFRVSSGIFTVAEGLHAFGQEHVDVGALPQLLQQLRTVLRLVLVHAPEVSRDQEAKIQESLKLAIAAQGTGKSVANPTKLMGASVPVASSRSPMLVFGLGGGGPLQPTRSPYSTGCWRRRRRLGTRYPVAKV